MLSLANLLIFLCFGDCLALGTEWSPKFSKKVLETPARIESRSEETEGNPPVILLIGGQRGRHVELISTDTDMTCNKVMAKFPLSSTKSAIGVINEHDQPLICDIDPICYAYNKNNNTWTVYNSTLQPSGSRTRAYSVQLANRNSLIIVENLHRDGSYDSKSTYYHIYNGRSFLEPIEMPNVGVKNICAAYSPWSDAIYVIGKTQTLRFAFEDRKFVRVAQNPVRLVKRACGVVQAEDGSDTFVVVGGKGSYYGTNSTYIFHSANGTWTQGQDYPLAMFGASSVPYKNTFLVIGGITRVRSTHWTNIPVTEIYKYEPTDGSWVDTGLRMSKVKKHPVALIGNYTELCL